MVHLTKIHDSTVPVSSTDRPREAHHYLDETEIESFRHHRFRSIVPESPFVPHDSHCQGGTIVMVPSQTCSFILHWDPHMGIQSHFTRISLNFHKNLTLLSTRRNRYLSGGHRGAGTIIDASNTEGTL